MYLKSVVYLNLLDQVGDLADITDKTM